MKIFNVKVNENPSIEDIEELIKTFKLFQGNEFDFNDIVKLCGLLNVEFNPKLNSGGSLMKFQSKDLIGVPGYTHGIFSIHIKHGGKRKIIVYKRNFLETLKHLEKVIKIKQSKK